MSIGIWNATSSIKGMVPFTLSHRPTSRLTCTYISVPRWFVAFGCWVWNWNITVCLTQLRAWEGLSSQLWQIFVSLLTRIWGNPKGGNHRDTREIPQYFTLVDICTVLSADESLSTMERKDTVGGAEGATITTQNGRACWVSLGVTSADAAACQAVYSEVLYMAWLPIAERVEFLQFPTLTAILYCYEFPS